MRKSGLKRVKQASRIQHPSCRIANQTCSQGTQARHSHLLLPSPALTPSQLWSLLWKKKETRTKLLIHTQQGVICISWSSKISPFRGRLNWNKELSSATQFQFKGKLSNGTPGVQVWISKARDDILKNSVSPSPHYNAIYWPHCNAMSMKILVSICFGSRALIDTRRDNEKHRAWCLP